jgi:hypothetical protein
MHAKSSVLLGFFSKSERDLLVYKVPWGTGRPSEGVDSLSIGPILSKFGVQTPKFRDSEAYFNAVSHLLFCLPQPQIWLSERCILQSPAPISPPMQSTVPSCCNSVQCPLFPACAQYYIRFRVGLWHNAGNIHLIFGTTLWRGVL